MKTLKWFLIIAIILILIAAIIFIYRHHIIQYSAETLIRKNLPAYLRIDTIRFEFENKKAVLEGFKIRNPSGFSSDYLLGIGEISCGYRLNTKNILDGIEITKPSLKEIVLNIERLRDGRTNIEEMGKVIGSSGSEAVIPAAENRKPKTENRTQAYPTKRIEDILKLPEEFEIKNGKIIFVDRMPFDTPYMLTFEDIEARLNLKFGASYSDLVSLASEGGCNLNGNRSEIIKWVTSLNPTTARLTMSNRFEVSNLTIRAFEPYYDKYSPLVFTKGLFSGTLIFDFDNGNIGSTNEIHLSDFQFYIKRGYESAAFWETKVPDLARYLTSPFGEIVFDFKIKGDMKDPRFQLGPISKRALISMAADKAVDILSDIAKSQGPSSNTSDAIEKAKEYIEFFKGLTKDK